MQCVYVVQRACCQQQTNFVFVIREIEGPRFKSRLVHELEKSEKSKRNHFFSPFLDTFPPLSDRREDGDGGGQIFNLEPVPLKSVRPMIFRTVNLDEEEGLDLKGSDKKQQQVGRSSFCCSLLLLSVVYFHFPTESGEVPA